MQKTAKTRNYGVTVAGIVILALALMILFFTIFVPRMRENKILAEYTDTLLFATYERVQVFDPLMKTEGVIADRGAEVMLTGEQVTALRERFATVVAAGFTNGENKPRPEGAWDTKWQIRTGEGAYVSLYFTEEEVYFFADGTAFCFTPKDLTAYDVFYAALCGTLTDR